MFFACRAGHGVLVPIADVAPEERAAVLVNAIYDDSPAAIATALARTNFGLGREGGEGDEGQEGEFGFTDEELVAASNGYLSVTSD